MFKVELASMCLGLLSHHRGCTSQSRVSSILPCLVSDMMLQSKDWASSERLAGADPEKWKERWLKWRTKGVLQNFQLINYSLGHFIALCQSMCFCSCKCSTIIMKRMKQATLFGFLVLKCSLFILSVWLICITLLVKMVCSSKSESVQVNQRVLKELVLWTLHT